MPESKTELMIAPPAQEESSSSKLMAIIEKMGHNPHVQVETLMQLLDVKERFERGEAKKSFDAAMAQFNRNIPVILKNKHVHYKKKDGSVVDYWHESLDSVVDAITAALAAVGISKRWTLQQEANGKITVSCVLTHAMGHSEAPVTLSAAPDDSGNKNSIQAIKSTVTYLQRTTLLAATGTAPKELVQDDDGRGAGPPQDDKPCVEDGRLTECLTWIREAVDFVILQRVFVAAVREAQELGDKDAQAQYIRAKDKRKAELRAGAQ